MTSSWRPSPFELNMILPKRFDLQENRHIFCGCAVFILETLICPIDFSPTYRIDNMRALYKVIRASSSTPYLPYRNVFVT